MAGKSKSKTSGSSAPKKITLIVSDQKSPEVALKPGMKFEVVAVTLQSPALKKAKATAAYLCGGTNTCIALTDVGE